MAIIDARGQPGLESLMNVLLQEKQNKLQKEQLAIQKQTAEIQQQQHLATQQQRKGEEEAAMRLLESLGRNQGVDPTAAPALLEGVQQQMQLESVLATNEAQRGLIDQQTRLAAQELRQNNDLFGLQVRAEEARIAASEAQTAEAQANLTFMDTQLRLGVLESAQRSMQNFGSLASIMGPGNASRMLFGADAPPSISALADEQLALIQGVESADELVSERLTRVAGVTGLPQENLNQLREAFAVGGNDPQAVVNAIYDQDLPKETKALLTGVVQGAFPDAPISIPPEEVGPFGRFWRTFKFELSNAASRPNARPLTSEAPRG